jgi:hypothetical protein
LSLEQVDWRDGAWEVAFGAAGRSHAVRVKAERGDLTLLTCSSDRPKRPLRYVVIPG